VKAIATIHLHVVPRARVTAVAGRHGDAIRVRLAAAPVDGAANEELRRFLAERLGVARGSLASVRGATGRRKTVTIDGMTVERAERALLRDNQ
jgi:uncharacterized protein YggU (UPF0235/DUF167 family)